MAQIYFESFALDPFESRPGSVDFPYDLHGIILRFEAVFLGSFDLLVVFYSPGEKAIFTDRIPFIALPFEPPGKLKRAKFESKADLRISRPGRYIVTAECDGKRLAETSFHVRQFPSIHGEHGDSAVLGYRRTITFFDEAGVELQTLTKSVGTSVDRPDQIG